MTTSLSEKARIFSNSMYLLIICKASKADKLKSFGNIIFKENAFEIKPERASFIQLVNMLCTTLKVCTTSVVIKYLPGVVLANHMC